MRYRTFHSFLIASLVLLILGGLALFSPLPVKGSGSTSVLTQRYDNSRTGTNLSETILNESNVNVSQFGKLFTRTVDGHIYAQPLYVPNLNIPGKGIHHVVYVATQHNTIFAFDANDPTASTPLWQTSLGTPAKIADASVTVPDFGPWNYKDIQVEVGTTSTPVIDLASNTLYAVAFTNETSASCTSGCAYAHRLHALDITTGAEKFGGPVLITATATGNSGVITFDSKLQLQRPALLLVNGAVYIAFGSYGDAGAYHGWVLGYDATTLQRVSVYCATPNGTQASIWQSGTGPSTDANGFVYVITANGTFSSTTQDYGDTFLKLNPAGVTLGILPLTDWFTPYNQNYLDTNDVDLGSTGAVLVPGTNLIAAGSKQGLIYLIDRSNMGHYNGPSGPDNVVQSFQAANGSIFGSPTFWNGPTGTLVYVWAGRYFFSPGNYGPNQPLRVFRFSGGLFQTTPVMTGTISTAGPGNMLALSANGSTAGTGILWALQPISSASQSAVPGILRAYDATNIANELWNSTLNAARDDFGNLAKFNTPTVVDGKVYVGTLSNQLVAYGLLNPTAVEISNISAYSEKIPIIPMAAFLIGIATIIGLSTLRRKE